MSNGIQIELEDFASKRRMAHSNDEDPQSIDENIVSQDGAIGLWAWTSAALYSHTTTLFATIVLKPRLILQLSCLFYKFDILPQLSALLSGTIRGTKCTLGPGILPCGTIRHCDGCGRIHPRGDGEKSCHVVAFADAVTDSGCFAY